jgi:RNA polymerase sigma-70 factor (ECF subfamily)
LTPDPSTPENAATHSPFAATRWTLVLRARGESPESKGALSELCAAYYPPVLLFLRREGRAEDVARELTQEFFARVLAGGGFDAADPQRGRFRSYLLGALKHFLADQRKHEAREKRGGGVTPESLDATANDDEAGSLQVADPSTPAPEACFDHQWALTVMARGLEALQQEFQREDKTDQFETLKPWLVGEAAGMSQAEAARRLNLTEGAVKVAVHRLRKRFRECIRAEIAQTLRDPAPALVDEELRHLVEALA